MKDSGRETPNEKPISLETNARRLKAVNPALQQKTEIQFS